MGFRYNNFGSELLDDNSGDELRLLCGPLRLRPTHLERNMFYVLWDLQVYTHLALHLLQQGGQQLIDRLKSLGVALLC